MVVAIILLMTIGYYFIMPARLFDEPHSTVIMDREGQLLSAAIARDGQWRFPELDSVPEKYQTAVLLFEDESFFYHPGFNPVSLARAAWQNLKAGHTVSGGSTITMQLVRLSRKGKARTITEKLIEIILATRIELTYSKEEILARYASYAPFGGNVVGLNAATWRYLGRDPYDLSWGEAALLAVLPNSPALIHPGRNRTELTTKRNKLLNKMLVKGIIDSLTYKLALDERIPEEPLPLPQLAPHLLTRVVNTDKGQKNMVTTLDKALQRRVTQIVTNHHRYLKGNEIYNAAVVVIDVSTQEVVAYVGNVSEAGQEHNNDVDIITAPRSTGSILKPFLYAAMLDEGQILPSSLVPDIPIFLKGFAPKNFSKTYDGAVHADKALSRSLNVPAVQMLRQYRYEKFHALLKEMGMTTLTEHADHYGLSIVLGGAEGKLWDIAGMYASLAWDLNHYGDEKRPFRLNYELNSEPDAMSDKTQGRQIFSDAAIYHTFTALLEVYRPTEESSWELFESSQKIAWKTGTSFGYRDAWAVGVTPNYVVGTWVGNADGEGRPGLTGVQAAAPLMFDVFDVLPKSTFFEEPAGLVPMNICRQSGYKASPICPDVDTLQIVDSGVRTAICPFHKLIHLDNNGYRVQADCEPVDDMKHQAWFVLPAVQEYYYKASDHEYKKIPPYRTDCQPDQAPVAIMEMVYPKNNSIIYIPKELDGSSGSAVFEVAHRRPETTIYWHLNDEYIGSTKRLHQLSVNPPAGDYELTLVDETGNYLAQKIKILSVSSE